ncbi:MAG: AAA family ATPase [Merdibacter sp.]
MEREEQLELLVEILLRREKANPLLVGEAGVGKSALVEALAQRIEAGEIAALKDHYIYALDINTLVAGTRYRGDFEEKLKKLIAAFRSHPNAILFIDELHQVIGAGRSEGSIDVASVLKPCLARRQLRCIGATTLEEYERHIEKDPALQRRFQCVRLMEPDPQQTRRILMARCEEYAGFHQVEIAGELIPTMIACADYYLPFGHFPDKALDVLDLSCAYARAHAQDKVDEICVREVIASLSQIPVDVEQRTRQTRGAHPALSGSSAAAADRGVAGAGRASPAKNIAGMLGAQRRTAPVPAHAAAVGRGIFPSGGLPHPGHERVSLSLRGSAAAAVPTALYDIVHRAL